MARNATAPAKKPEPTPNVPAVKEQTKSQEVVIANDDFLAAMQSAGSGLENVTARNLIIPRITILQGLSPQVTRGKPEFDPDARVGDIYDVGLQENFGEAFDFLPVHFVTQWLEWAPRESGKGLQRIHDSGSIMNQATEQPETRRMVLPNGNYIAEVAQFYGFNCSAGFRKTFLPMGSTQLKKSRRLLTLATTEKIKKADGSEFTPALYYRSYTLSTVAESNAKGSWIGWKIERSKTLLEFANVKAVMQEVVEFRNAIVAGELRGDVGEQDIAEAPSNDGAM
jgi:hypothetical protein